VLNHYDLGLYVESCLKSFEISELPGLWDLKYRNLITSVIFLYLCSYNLVSSVTMYSRSGSPLDGGTRIGAFVRSALSPSITSWASGV
jgi:hypothetical protein